MASCYDCQNISASCALDSCLRLAIVDPVVNRFLAIKAVESKSDRYEDTHNTHLAKKLCILTIVAQLAISLGETFDLISHDDLHNLLLGTDLRSIALSHIVLSTVAKVLVF